MRTHCHLKASAVVYLNINFYWYNLLIHVVSMIIVRSIYRLCENTSSFFKLKRKKKKGLPMRTHCHQEYFKFRLFTFQPSADGLITLSRGCTSGGVDYVAFTCMPGESYCRCLRSLLPWSCDVVGALINSLVCWFCLTLSVSRAWSSWLKWVKHHGCLRGTDLPCS